MGQDLSQKLVRQNAYEDMQVVLEQIEKEIDAAEQNLEVQDNVFLPLLQTQKRCNVLSMCELTTPKISPRREKRL